MAGKIAGVDVLVQVDTGTAGTPNIVTVGGQSGATLKRTAKAIDVTSKDSAGWSDFITGVKTWDIDCDAFYVDGDTALQALEDAFNNRTAVNVDILMPSGKKYSGSAYVSDMSLDFPESDAVKLKISLKGNGALTYA